MADPTPQIMQLSEEEQAWLLERRTAALESGLLISDEQLAESFDNSRDQYLEAPADVRGDATHLVNIYAVAFGEYLSKEFDLQWCIIENEGSADLGLYSPNKEMVLMPIATVTKRWNDAARRPMIDLIQQTRASLAQASEAP